MPLSKVRRPTKANCRANVSKNIRTLKAEGRPQGQSVAIALSVAKKCGCKVGKAKKGPAKVRKGSPKRPGLAAGSSGENLTKFMHVPATVEQYRHIVADALAEEHKLSERAIKRIMTRKSAIRWVNASFRASKYPSLMAYELVALEEDRGSPKKGHSTGSRPPVPRELQREWMSRGIDVQRAVDRARQVTAVRKRPETAVERRNAIIFFTQAARDFRAAGDEATAQLFLEAAEAQRRGIDTRNMELPAVPVSRDQSAWARNLNREERAQIALARAGHGRASGSKSSKPSRTRAEITWESWYTAAGLAPSINAYTIHDSVREAAYKAWKSGVNPRDWRAARGTKKGG